MIPLTIRKTFSTLSLAWLLHNTIFSQTAFSKNLLTDSVSQSIQNTSSCAVDSDEEIQKALGDIKTKTAQKAALVCLEYQNNSLKITLFKEEKTIEVSSSPISIQELRDTIDSLQNSVANPLLKNTNQYLEPAQKLYDLLIKPIEKEIPETQIETLVFVNNIDAPSFSIEVLHDGAEFIIENYSISRIFAVNQILKISQFLEILTDEVHQNLDVLVMGTSRFKNSSTELSGIQNELFQAGGSWNRNSDEEFLTLIPEEKFNIEKLREALLKQDFEIIHIATHGVFNRDNPERSYLSLWDDRLLFTELKDLLRDREVEILVLSACNTATATEDGKLGLEQFVSETKVKTIIASQWSAYNLSAYLIMTRFPQQFALYGATSRSRLYGFRKAENFRTVQLEMLNKQLYLTPESGYLDSTQIEEVQQEIDRQNNNNGVLYLDHPYYWAAFTVIGSPW